MALGSNDDIKSAQNELGRNAFGGTPRMTGLGIYCELHVHVGGIPDARTGYLINIAEIDHVVANAVIPEFQRCILANSAASAECVLAGAFDVLMRSWCSVTSGEARMPSVPSSVLHALQWNLTPYYSLAMCSSSHQHVLMTQSFEFSAAHRLHCPELDDATNRAVFGKCNNPSGHGHNYRVEVTIRKPLDAEGARFTLADLEVIVHDAVIKRFDHRHLNIDVKEFATLNPSVENIARVCHDLLITPIEQAGAHLRRVTVWETEKTSCSYPADGLWA